MQSTQSVQSILRGFINVFPIEKHDAPSVPCPFCWTVYSIAAESDTTSGRVHRPYHITTIVYPGGMFGLFPLEPPPKETTLCNPQSPSMKISSFQHSRQGTVVPRMAVGQHGGYAAILCHLNRTPMEPRWEMGLHPKVQQV